MYEQEKIKIERKLEEVLLFAPAEYIELIDAMRYSLLSGGKRIRPLLLLRFFALCGGTNDGALSFAAALEMIHTYSLIHDDLPTMDNDDMRRGRPSCHKAFGEATALLAGDALLTMAFSVAAKTKGILPERVVKAIAELSDCAGTHGMVAGQVMDLRFEQETPSLEALTEMVRNKTGRLLEAAAAIGCILAGAEEETVALARKYALSVGLAFQMIDDVLDQTADEAVLGKPVGSDQKNGKTTFVTLLGLEETKKRAAAFTEKALAVLDEMGGDTADLKAWTEELLVRKY